MTTRHDLIAVLQRYDDDAWAALASKGLLRRARKDLKVDEVAEVAAEPVEVRVGEHTVTFASSRPSEARCTCPASTVCQHVLAASLWLVGRASEITADEPNRDENSLHAELMSLDQGVLEAYGGRAALRWAAQYVADLDDGAVRITGGQLVQIALPRPRVTYRFMGGGLDGLIPDVRMPAAEKYALAAVLAFQRANGADPIRVEPLRRRETATSRAREGSRDRLLDAGAALLLDTARVGASHLSPAMHQRFETMAVWAQGAELYRLALLLRRLSDQVELLLDRNVRADEHALLDETAIAYALVSALRAAGEPPRRLVGRARTTYDAVRTMELVGLGGVPWHTSSGYRGLTCLFWWIEEQRFVSWTDARPDALAGFEPRARYAQPGPWTGLASPAASAGRRIVLTRAQLSPEGRLSGVDRTHATVTPASTPPWPDDRVVRSWVQLEDRAHRGGSLLDEPDPLRDWTVLAPESVDEAIFDPIRQTVWWVLRDDAGAGFPLSLRWTSLSAHAVQRLESLGSAGLPEGAFVVARVANRGGVLTGEPLSIVRPDGSVDSLHFDPVGGSVRAPARGPVNAAEASEEEDEAPVPLPPALRDLRTWLLRNLERGTASVPPDTLRRGLELRHRAARDQGFSVFASPTGKSDPAESLLQSLYLGLQVSALLA